MSSLTMTCWRCTNCLCFYAAKHPFGPDRSGAEEAADHSGPALHQQHEALLHRQVQRLRPGGNEVQHPGSALLQHPRRRWINGGAQDQVNSSLWTGWEGWLTDWLIHWLDYLLIGELTKINWEMQHHLDSAVGCWEAGNTSSLERILRTLFISFIWGCPLRLVDKPVAPRNRPSNSQSASSFSKRERAQLYQQSSSISLYVACTIALA